MLQWAVAVKADILWGSSGVRYRHGPFILKKLEENVMDGDQVDKLIAMADGNPGAASAMSHLAGPDGENFSDILELEDLGHKGPQIWMGYKYYANFDVEKWRTAIQTKDPEMLKACEV